jgi:hypothetical protein
MEVYETENSRYTFDTESHRYKREAINQQVVVSHRLTYDEWLPLREYKEEGDHLRIFAEDSVIGIVTSPIKSRPGGGIGIHV